MIKKRTPAWQYDVAFRFLSSLDPGIKVRVNEEVKRRFSEGVEFEGRFVQMIDRGNHILATR
jgi:hypothetical protein